ncbi:uncharacterized protein ARMOST_21029 [Armillaria ostoyae]|uniref:Uncharacterized protein n=1 Tax=Armillaria ostoyae TaxID=47428 RepID=A0A284S8Z0_ARMOS|nr:uncharacterized protein ARMOST_21029 [Armillaria ostoyae]
MHQDLGRVFGIYNENFEDLAQKQSRVYSDRKSAVFSGSLSNSLITNPHASPERSSSDTKYEKPDELEMMTVTFSF